MNGDYALTIPINETFRIAKNFGSLPVRSSIPCSAEILKWRLV